MISETHRRTGRLRHSVRWLPRVFIALNVLLGILGLQGPVSSPRVALAQTNTLQIEVVSARDEPDHPDGPVLKGDEVTEYKYLLNVDNTGEPIQPRDPDCSPYVYDTNGEITGRNPDYPDSCDWPSVREVPGSAPIFTQGDQADFADGGITLPEGKYLISVLADGYKVGGAHFSVPLPDPDPGTGANVVVGLQPHPLPAATMRIKVFQDITPVNGQFDAPAEAGLEGFMAVILDPAGDITTDVFGNPLCTEYDENGDPIPGTGTTDCLYSDTNGDIVIPNVGPNRYDVEIAPPPGEGWLHTTTLEGSWSFDTWLAEGGTGLDNEFVVAAEPFPWTWFGFTKPMNDLPDDPAVTGGVSGTIAAASVYLPQQNALPYQGGIWGGLNGAKVTGPIEDAWVALSDLQQGDTAVYVGQANPDGSFHIPNVPDGNYLFTWWDEKLHYILDWTQITVSDGDVYDMGTQMLTGWFTQIEGYVFNDLNKNGKKDEGEPGIANYPVVLRDRDNSEIDRMSVMATTDKTGYYVFERAYPMGSWMVLEAYNTRYYGTGVTYQVENQPEPTTVLGDGVDVGILPILGQGGRLDWGIHEYESGTNGGIGGTVWYDVTRNEFDARYQAVEPWSPGIPGLTVKLYDTVPCGTNGGAPCDPTNTFEVEPDGALKKGTLLNQTETETWQQPVDCTARDANGNPLPSPEVQEVLAPYEGGYRCLEGPVMGTQFSSDFSTVDGNWGFTEVLTDPVSGTPLDEPMGIPADDYLVEVVIPEDDFGRPIYQVVREEDINVFDGDQYEPAVPPSACAGALHTVDVAEDGTDGYPAIDLGNGVVVPASEPVDNPNFADQGGSPYEGEAMPLCDTKLVTLNNGTSIAPDFTLFTEVPIPGKWKGYIIDDLSLSFDKRSLYYGEKAGLPDAPIGVYDFNNRLVTTIRSDFNGTYEILLPSTHTASCPSPSGICASMYYILGNDPGQPGQLNTNYNPQYRTIGATFEIWPGQMVPSDLAPTQMVIGVLNPSSEFQAPPACDLEDTTPQLFAVSQPYVHLTTPPSDTAFTIQGRGFGDTEGLVTLDGAPLPIYSWSENEITVTVPSRTPFGPHQLLVTAANGRQTVNGLTFHVIGGGYTPEVYEVRPEPDRGYATIQDAINAAADTPGQDALVVVYPDTPEQWNPGGAYYENLIMHTPVKLQGIGPGGVYTDTTGTPVEVLGSVIDGRGVAGDTDYAEEWRIFVREEVEWDGLQNIYEGPVVYVLAEQNEFTQRYKAAVDGFTIQGGDQQGFPNNFEVDPALKEAMAVQGGGIFANAFARHVQITNNIMKSNGGAYAGAIRLGTPHVPEPYHDHENDFVRIAHNRILANGGTNLAGAIGLFSGSEGYEIAYNDICGNFSAEYGGGISHYGYSPDGSIHHNRIIFNRSYDEGGGIIIAGELPADPATLTPGAGPVDVYANLIQGNLGNDDGGGLRFLMAGDFPYNVYNNMIVNNITTHEGGGVSLNDAPDVRFYNNTVMKNISTATAVTSNGQPAPAGLSTVRNSALLQEALPAGAPIFSEPLLFNNVFWDNRAGTWTGDGIAGIGQPGDPNPINYWDLGVADGTGLLAPTNTLMQVDTGTIFDASNIYGEDPLVVEEYDLTVQALPWRGNPNFVDPLIVAVDQPVELMGDYHLQSTSPARDAGADSKEGISAPSLDIDDDGRPQGTAFDAGADEWFESRTGLFTTPVLDDFNQPDAPLVAAFSTQAELADNWTGDAGSFAIVNQEVQVQDSGSAWWSAETFGPDQEAYLTLTGIAADSFEQALMLKLTGDPTAGDSSLVEIRFDATSGISGTVQVWSKSLENGWVLHGAVAAPLSPGDVLGGSIQANGTVDVLSSGRVIYTVNLRSGPTPWPEALVSAGGKIGVHFVGPDFTVNEARFDDFGGGNWDPQAQMPWRIFMPIVLSNQ